MRDKWQESESEVLRVARQARELLARDEAGEDIPADAGLALARALIAAVRDLGEAVEEETDG